MSAGRPRSHHIHLSCLEHDDNTFKQFLIVSLLPQSKLPACLQAQLLPFGKALKAFLERVTSPNAHPDKAAAEANNNSTHKVLQFVKTLAQATNAYPPAMAENIVFVLRCATVGSAAFCEQSDIGKVACTNSILSVYTCDLELIVNQCLATMPELQGADLASPHTTIIRMICHLFAYTCT